MSSGRSSWLQLNILYKIPFLYKTCSEGNYHLITDKICYCRTMEGYDQELFAPIWDEIKMKVCDKFGWRMKP